jgi:uncharacterized protein YjiS (DUF1127 family)
VQSMSTHQSQYRSAAALFVVAASMQAAGRHVCAAAKWLHSWLEQRRVAAAAFHDFRTMGERELLDIGLTRVDVHRVAWGASDRNHIPT